MLAQMLLDLETVKKAATKKVARKGEEPAEAVSIRQRRLVNHHLNSPRLFRPNPRSRTAM